MYINIPYTLILSDWMKEEFEDKDMVRAPQARLALWSQKRLSKMNDVAKQAEMQRMSTGREAAESAMKAARQRGGDLTVSGFLDPKLQPSENLLVLSLTGKELLTYVFNLLNAASSSVEDLKTFLGITPTIGMVTSMTRDYSTGYSALLKEA